MRKSLIATIVLVFLSGCVTNPYIEVDYARRKKPPGPALGYISCIIPGLPQLLNEEYLEAAIYFGAFLIPGLISTAMFEGKDINALEGEDALYYNLITGISIVPLVAGAIDGIITTNKRNDQYREIRKAYISRSFDKKTADAIRNNRIFIGMVRAALIESWGEPSDINKSTGVWGIKEQFVYPGKTEYERVYVYVENGKVTAWQN